MITLAAGESPAPSAGRGNPPASKARSTNVLAKILTAFSLSRWRWIPPSRKGKSAFGRINRQFNRERTQINANAIFSPDRRQQVIGVPPFFGVWVLAFVIFSCNFSPALRSFSEAGSIRGFQKES
jgi:hypothetical protein